MRSTDPTTVARLRELRASGLPLADVAAAVGVAPSTVLAWTRDIAPPPRESWRRGERSKGALHEAKLADIAAAHEWAAERLSVLSDDAFFAAGIALYIGEGHKRDGAAAFTNTDPRVVACFLRWLRTYFRIDESRLRAVLYLHAHLDLDQATRHWSGVTGIPPAQFGKPYRATPDLSIRVSKHAHGCLTVRYSCSATHRRVTALCDRLLSSTAVDPA